MKWDWGQRHSVSLADAVASIAPKPLDVLSAGEGVLDLIAADGLRLTGITMNMVRIFLRNLAWVLSWCTGRHGNTAGAHHARRET